MILSMYVYLNYLSIRLCALGQPMTSTNTVLLMKYVNLYKSKVNMKYQCLT